MTVNALLPSTVDYSDADKASLDVRLRALIESVFPTWTDHTRADFGNLLCELFTNTLDILHKYQCNQAAEAFIAYATQRKSMLSLAKLTAFTPRTAVASTVDCTFSIPAPVAGDVPLPAGTTARTSAVTAPKVFQLLHDLLIAAGLTSAVGAVENSDPDSDTFESDGTPNQSFVLTSRPYLDGSAVVTVGVDTYTQVDDFLGSTATSKHFTLVVDANDRATITFGNGISGQIPAVGAFSVAYKTGGGASGNVIAGAINKVDGSFTDSLGTPVVVSVTNPFASDGGEDRMSVASMRQLIPAAMRAQSRCIAREDFEIAALLIPGVGRALMLTAIENPGIPDNRGYLYVVPPAGGTPSSAIKAAVLTGVMVTRPGPVGFGVDVLDPIYLTISVHAKVWIRAGYTPATVAASIRANLSEYFVPCEVDGTPNQLVDFGYYLKDENGDPSYILALSDIFDVVKDTLGVLRMGTALADFTLNAVHDNVAITLAQFPKIGTIEIVDGATGAIL